MAFPILRNLLHLWPMGWGALAIAFVAALIMAVNQAMKEAPVLADRIKWRPISGRWNYLPFALFLVALVIWAWGTFPTGERGGLVSDDASQPPATIEIEGLPVEEIMGFYENHTGIEAERYTARYYGQTVTVRGVIADVNANDFTSFAPERGIVGYVNLEQGEVDYSVALTFNNASPAILNLQRGERIVAECRFERGAYRYIAIFFQDCELTEGPLPPINTATATDN